MSDNIPFDVWREWFERAGAYERDLEMQKRDSAACKAERDQAKLGSMLFDRERALDPEGRVLPDG
jgi:hypothetical protein